MKTYQLLFLLVAVLSLSACATAPVTGRSQLLLVSADQEQSLGLSEAETILKESKQSTDKALVARVTNVGKRIVAASPDAQKYQWSFYVLDDKTVNAFALPGGKVFFYTGILALMDNDDQIATVMGHEIAHVLARHGAERMSQQMLANTGSQILASALNVSAQYASLYNTAYGVATNVGVILPFSRQHESEADHIGVVLMHKAGFDPNQAVVFWKKMAAQGKGASPEFLSTHPSDERRIKAIEAEIKTLK